MQDTGLNSDIIIWVWDGKDLKIEIFNNHTSIISNCWKFWSKFMKSRS